MRGTIFIGVMDAYSTMERPSMPPLYRNPVSSLAEENNSDCEMYSGV